MALTHLDPKTALMVIDLQKGILALPAVHPIAEVVKRAGALTEAFRRHGLPVVLVNADGAASGRTEQAPRFGEFPAAWTDLLPELNRQAEDHTVTKRTWGAFTNTGLADHLKRLGETGTAKETMDLLKSRNAS